MNSLTKLCNLEKNAYSGRLYHGMGPKKLKLTALMIALININKALIPLYLSQKYPTKRNKNKRYVYCE
jgi:hypothetical protein